MFTATHLSFTNSIQLSLQSHLLNGTKGVLFLGALGNCNQEKSQPCTLSNSLWKSSLSLRGEVNIKEWRKGRGSV